MARYADVPDHLKITSERIEPVFGYVLGRWYAQSEYMEKTYGRDSLEYIDALENLWHGIRCLSNLSSLCIDTHHASIAASNHTGQIATYIEAKLGFNPLSVDEDQPFRARAHQQTG